jgi:hypothetical protein
MSVRILRRSGAFFTPSRLANAVAARLGRAIPRSARICDPTCGAGDLLLAVARRLPIADHLPDTLLQWGTQLCGSDIERSFVSATKLRLALLAFARQGDKDLGSRLQLHSLLPGFSSTDFLQSAQQLDDATHIILNPPFTAVAHSAEWAVGSVTSAAIFMERCVYEASASTRIVAILPEVLRSGSRYERWRQAIQSKARINDVVIAGQFDRWTDVDVFIADLTVRPKALARSKAWPRKPNTSSGLTRVSGLFEVAVGPVVAYRDPHDGPICPYIDTASAPRWQVMRSIAGRRRYRGRTFASPLVVVRRTSRPGDRHRAVATLVSSGSSIAVENHLMVLLPKDRRFATCRRLVAVLRNPLTTKWLNREIRCRHLTVDSLRRLPMWRSRR